MDEIVFVNSFLIGYSIITVIMICMYRKTMAVGAVHHLLSHTYLVIFFLIALNLYVSKGWTSPLIFVMLYVIQHVTKENIRLVKTNRWTDSVKDVS